MCVCGFASACLGSIQIMFVNSVFIITGFSSLPATPFNTSSNATSLFSISDMMSKSISGSVIDTAVTSLEIMQVAELDDSVNSVINGVNEMKINRVISNGVNTSLLEDCNMVVDSPKRRRVEGLV